MMKKPMRSQFKFIGGSRSILHFGSFAPYIRLPSCQLSLCFAFTAAVVFAVTQHRGSLHINKALVAPGFWIAIP
jgi:hypothetical protein